MSTTRRLAAILLADVVGYCRLMYQRALTLLVRLLMTQLGHCAFLAQSSTFMT